MEAVIELDKQITVFLNGLHTPLLDPVFWFASKTNIWIPLYAYFLFLIYKTEKGRIWIHLIAIALVVTLADRFTSGFMKPYFARLRPTHDPSVAHLLHIVNNYKGGQFGFASSHAANTFGVAAYLFFLWNKKFKPSWLLFVWAAFVSYSRIYLGVHYLGDIFVGGLVGFLFALIVYFIQQKLTKTFSIKKQLTKND